MMILMKQKDDKPNSNIEYRLGILPPLSLVGNPLFVPYYRLESIVEEDTKLSKDMLLPALDFHRTHDHLWRSYFHEPINQIWAMTEGSLVKLTRVSEKKTWFGVRIIQVNYELAPMDKLLKEGLLIKTDYETAFSNLGILPYYQDELAKIHPSQNRVFQVPDAKFERDGAVALMPTNSNYIRRKPVKDALKELLENLLPPVRTPQNR